MVPEIPGFSSLPAPARGVAILAAGGGISAALLAVGLPSVVIAVVVVGVAVVLLLVGIYAVGVKWAKKRKARPMEQGVLRSSAGGLAVSDPERLARIDDLRKKFEEGIATFRTAGKSLYSLPWYVILGEPGSGKTEAVRHCGIGFPPGLHDQFQGVGGTINMNWWFTDHGVIIDTAGRLMFDEAEASRTSEWKEFLRLLGKYRSNCPINGAFLVIPADSLIKDSADEIERKASKIAQQFDVIQRTLDVRFPVYVVISKCDLITGFREFFANLDDPQLQHQILGWSNPGELDEPYDPQFVDQHLQAIQAQLFRRRLTRLQQVTASRSEHEDKPAVEALYAFPHSLAQIAPRLTRYLDLIFSVGSQWSCKPLFFRGIFFTSSMQEGAALDEDLAVSLGIPVEALPEGPVFRRDRAYFLRDLFTKKVFQERRLVTRATNAKRQHRRRQAAVLLAAAATVVIMIALTVVFSATYRERIGRLDDYLRVVYVPPARGNPGGLDAGSVGIVDGHNYGGSTRVYRRGKRNRPLAFDRCGYWAELAKATEAFRRMMTAHVDEVDGLDDALDWVYHDGILKPLLGKVQTNWQSGLGRWAAGDDQFKALEHVIRVKAGTFDPNNMDHFLDSLLLCAGFPPDEKGQPPYKQHTDKWHGLSEELEHALSVVDPNRIETLIDNGIRRFNAYWENAEAGYAQSDGLSMEGVRALIEALKRFDKAEQELLGDYCRGTDCDRIAQEWGQKFQDLRVAKTALDVNRVDVRGPLPNLWRNAALARKAAFEPSYEALLQTFEKTDPESEAFFGARRSEVNRHLKTLRDQLNPDDPNGLATLDNMFLRVSADGTRAYQRRFALYSEIDDCFAFRETIGAVGRDDAAALKEIVSKVVPLNEMIDDAKRHKGDFKGFARIDESVGPLLDCAKRLASRDIVEKGAALLERMRVDKEGGVDRADVERVKGDVRTLLDACTSLQDALTACADTRLDKTYKPKIAAKRTVTVDLYVRYWFDVYLPKTIDKHLAAVLPAKGDWSHVFTALCDLSIDIKLNALKDAIRTPCGEELIWLKENHGSDIQETYKDNLGLFEEQMRNYDDDVEACEKRLAKWETLHSDPQTARLYLARSTSLKDDYFGFLPSEAVPARFVRYYWTALTKRCLIQLADEVQGGLNNSLMQLREYSRLFPLNRSAKTSISPQDLARMHSLLEEVEPVTPQSVETKDAEIHGQLKRLWEPAFRANEQQRLDQVAKVIRCLPRDANSAYYCKVTLPGTKGDLSDDKRSSFAGTCRDIALEPEGKGGSRRRWRVREPDDFVLGVVKIPCQATGFRVLAFQYPGDVEEYDGVEIAEPWAVWRMFLETWPGSKGRLESVPSAGPSGIIKLRLKEGGELELRLEFYGDADCRNRIENVPVPAEWPQWPW